MNSLGNVAGTQEQSKSQIEAEQSKGTAAGRDDFAQPGMSTGQEVSRQKTVPDLESIVNGQTLEPMAAKEKAFDASCNRLIDIRQQQKFLRSSASRKKRQKRKLLENQAKFGDEAEEQSSYIPQTSRP